MKNKNNYLYTSGEFSKLAGINKRTLHYYNDIGLFQPAIIKENGFHYYSCFQFAELEMILTLRKMGLSIDEIHEYIAEPSNANFTQMMEKRKQFIDNSIKQLLTVQSFLEQKYERLELGFSAKHGKIEICEFSERKIVRSKRITGKYDEEDFSVAAEFALRLKKLFHLYDSFGSAISIESIINNDFNNYDYFFAYCPSNSSEYDEILPKGTYLRAYCIGEWKQLPEIYKQILTYAKKHNLKLTGYAYEEGLNEMSIKEKKEYVTMITIKCEKII